MKFQFTLEQLEHRAQFRAPGYKEDVLKIAKRLSDEVYELDTDSEEYQQLLIKYRHPAASNIPTAMPEINPPVSVNMNAMEHVKPNDMRVYMDKQRRFRQELAKLAQSGIKVDADLITAKIDDINNILKNKELTYSVQQYKAAISKSNCSSCTKRRYQGSILWYFVEAFNNASIDKQAEIRKLLK